MKHPVHLILTVDYEIFGNGSGDVDCCVIKPANKMIHIANQFNAPITFFVEVLEFMILEQNTNTAVGAKKVKIQLLDALKNNHDAQLHLHPQWHNARLDNDENWELDMQRWRIGDLRQDEITALFQRGKMWLEELLKPAKKNYQCHTFRAGGWCIQPSQAVVRAMQSNGFNIDSTVAPGVKNSTKNEWSDFRIAPNMPFWRSENDVCKASDSGIWEVPIITGRIGRLKHLQALKISRNQANGGMATNCHGSYQGPDGKFQAVLGKVEKLFRLGQVMLDFSTMSSEIMIDITEQWLENFNNSNSSIPLVAIAHTKNFTVASEKALEEYLRWAKLNDILFSTYGQWLEMVDPN
jgi:hypothetical protein